MSNFETKVQDSPAPSREKYIAQSHDEHISHGNSIAAWTLVLLVIAGTAIGAVGYILTNWPVIITGIVIIVIGLIAGPVLKAMGYGVDGEKTKEMSH